MELERLTKKLKLSVSHARDRWHLFLAFFHDVKLAMHPFDLHLQSASDHMHAKC